MKNVLLGIKGINSAAIEMERNTEIEENNYMFSMPYLIVTHIPTQISQNVRR